MKPKCVWLKALLRLTAYVCTPARFTTSFTAELSECVEFEV